MKQNVEPRKNKDRGIFLTLYGIKRPRPAHHENCWVAASVIDADNYTLSITTLSQPVNGTLVELVGGWHYAPATNFNGADTFTFEALDGTASSEIATVTVLPQPVDPVTPSVPVTVNNKSSGGGSVNGLWLLVTLMIAWRRRQMAIRWLQYHR